MRVAPFSTFCLQVRQAARGVCEHTRLARPLSHLRHYHHCCWLMHTHGLRSLRAVFFFAVTLSLLVANRPRQALANREPTDTATIVHWDDADQSLPPLPDAHGFAGMYGGVCGDYLIAAGGANFPDRPPWEGGMKVWYDTIYVYAIQQGRWSRSSTPLPQPLAYGVSVSCVVDGKPSVVCVGGDNGQQPSQDAFALRIEDGDVVLQRLPGLPVALTGACGALVGDKLLVAGGQSRLSATTASHDVFQLDLASGAASRQWERLTPIPGPGRIQAIAGGHAGRFYVFGGIELSAGADGSPQRVTPYLRTALAWDTENQVGEGSWQRLTNLPHPVAASPGPAPLVGASQFLILGGPDGSLLSTPPDEHPGFPRQILTYDVVLDRWAIHGELPADNSRVTAPLVMLQTDRLAIVSGESRPGVRSPTVPTATIHAARPSLQQLDWWVLSLYLGLLVAMGVYFSRRGKTTDDFFLAGKRVPWWAAALSVFGTQLSAITYLSIPARTYATNWTYYVMNCGILAIAPIVVFYYLPHFRRQQMTSAYEYLERRFGLSVRLFGSASFIVFQMARMGIVVLLPALALSAVTGIDLYLCIATIGLLSTIYTVLGGIEAVVWTDVIQVFVLIGGAIAALFVVVAGIQGGLLDIVSTGIEFDKLRLVNAEWSWVGDALPVIVVGAIFANLVPYTTDQSVIQRYLTTPTEQAAARAIWGNGAMSVVASALFFFVGTALFVFYREHTDRMVPLSQADQLFPWFIANELPAGLSGLVIAGIFAAAMSSLDSSMHSIATALSTDYVQRLRPTVSDQQLLRFAKWATLGLGLLGTLTSMLLATIEIRFLWDLFLEFIGLLGGTLCGLFMLGVFTRRPLSLHAWLGIAASVLALGYVKFFTSASGLTYAAVGTLTCFATGWLSAWVIRRDGRKGLASR